MIVEVMAPWRGKPGAHQRVDGIDYDCERQAEAMLQGYAFMRVSGRMARDGRALGVHREVVETGDRLMNMAEQVFVDMILKALASCNEDAQGRHEYAGASNARLVAAR